MGVGGGGLKHSAKLDFVFARAGRTDDVTEQLQDGGPTGGRTGHPAKP